MTKINVPFVVRGQNIYQKAPPKRLSAGGQNYFFATFDFDETWKSIPYKKATFRLGKDAPIVVDIAESECVIPHEMMQNPGVFTVGVFGGDLLPTGTATVEVMEGVLTAGDDPEPPTPDWFDRIENRLDNLEEGGGGGGGGGQDGYSPKAKVEKVGSVATITITDKSGTTTAEVHDGEPGERGEPGPAGADGKDYVLTGADKQTIATQAAGLVSVPVQSVNGKTGEVNLTAKDVGALPSDTQIPDPYTLPTASADTKGGVRIGPDFVMDGDVMGVKPEGEYELLIKTTIEHEVAQYALDAVEGEPIKLERAFVRMICPETAGRSGVGSIALCRYFFQRYGASYHESRNDKAVTNTIRFTVFGEAYKRNGYWHLGPAKTQAYEENPLNFAEYPMSPYRSMMKLKTENTPHIVYITVSGLTADYTIPAGTTIEIWGVRADA